MQNVERMESLQKTNDEVVPFMLDYGKNILE